MMTILTTCPICGKDHEINVEFADYLNWQNDTLVQDAFPYLSADEREMLISGICSSCWNKMWGDENDD